jgi:hydrogenase/urease accessory protein HupE
MNRTVYALLALLAASPAFAHPGDHSHFDWAGFWAHLFEPDHLFFAAAALVASLLAYRAGRRAEARIHASKDQNHDPR